MEKCVFSVIMPCFNSEEYVSIAIESIITQTYPHWELIIVNDGSTDSTLSIINKYASSEKRIKVFSKANGGYATAINYGLDKISGDYFLFLGSDDYLNSRLFEKLAESFDQYKILPDMCAFRTRIVREGNIVSGLDTYTLFDEPLLSRCSFKDFTEQNPKYSSIFSIRDTSRCYKTTLLNNTRYFGKTGIDADGIFSMLICHKASSFMNIPIDGYYWYIRSGSVSSSVSLEKHLDRISNWHSFFEILSDRYPTEITSTEKQYLLSLSHFIVELSSTPKNAIKYRKRIKEEAAFCICTAGNANAPLLRWINIVSKAPLAFALLFSCRTKLAAIRSNTVCK